MNAITFAAFKNEISYQKVAYGFITLLVLGLITTGLTQHFHDFGIAALGTTICYGTAGAIFILTLAVAYYRSKPVVHTIDSEDELLRVQNHLIDKQFFLYQYQSDKNPKITFKKGPIISTDCLNKIAFSSYSDCREMPFIIVIGALHPTSQPNELYHHLGDQEAAVIHSEHGDIWITHDGNQHNELPEDHLPVDVLTLNTRALRAMNKEMTYGITTE